EEILVAELASFEIIEPQITQGAVRCKGNQETLYRLNLGLRTALHVLQEVYTGTLSSVQDLYKAASSIAWETFISPSQTLSVTLSSSKLSWISPKYAPLVVKDAVCDRFTKLYGVRPSVDTRSPSLRIHLHLENHKGTLSIDTSGESLHKRGYRTEKTEAPLSEVLAAGILQLIHWNPNLPLYDPMCGSGTFLIEAGLMALGIPPGSLRKSFAFTQWKVFNAELFNRVRAQRLKCPDTSIAIYGSDKDEEAVQIARRNIQRAGLAEYLNVNCANFGDWIPPRFSSQGGMLLMNPPYGKRLKDSSLIELYKHIGDILKQKFYGSEAWIFSGNPDALKYLGLQPFRKYHLRNGPLLCKLVGFTLIRGKYQKHRNGTPSLS
ncbi:MAG: THUMP domain-containing protein, partial [Spirochaetales bacterium]